MTDEPNEKKKTSRPAIIIVATMVFSFMFVLAMLGIVKAFDFIIWATYETSSLYPEKDEPIVFDMYPYSAGHMAGDMLWDGEIQIGQMGYWYPDFDFNNPPIKNENEFRIILVGGSGAQGQGGTIPNEQMLYAQIEMRLNQYLAHTGKQFRVINMAMGGSITYHNFVDLNLLAHKLEPDLILSYSGFNDYSVPTFFGFDSALLNTSQADNNKSDYVIPVPPWQSTFNLSVFRDVFPNLIAAPAQIDGVYTIQTTFPAKSAFMKKKQGQLEEERSVAEYFTSKKDFFERMVVPLYIGSLKSIRRDFPGLPIMLAWQSIEKHPDEFTEFGNSLNVLGPQFYNQMFERTKLETSDYGQGDWLYINTHRMYEDDPRLFGFHMTPQAQGVNGDAIAQKIALYFDKEYAQTNPNTAIAIENETYNVQSGYAPKVILGAMAGWSEEAYLYAYPDVAELIEKGEIESGWQYYKTKGKAEGKLDGSPVTWNESGYLEKNPDVFYFVNLGELYSCGYEHWVKSGRAEGRKGGEPQ